MSAWGDRGGNRVAFVQFQLHSRMLRYDVPTPDVEDYRHDKGGRKRNAGAQQAAADAEHRRRWRALHLIIKAKLEIVASGDSSFDREFLADIMLPDGGTVGGHMLPQVAEAYASGKMPKLLPGKR